MGRTGNAAEQTEKRAGAGRAFPEHAEGRKVANSGAFTKPKTSWMMSIALLYIEAKYAARMLNPMPTTVMTLPVRK